jgi:AbrB family transcriptional regulator, stage V sporulation protein T
MKATGIVRRIDLLGRVVIPKEIRRTLRLQEGDPLEIFIDQEQGVIFKKYSSSSDLIEFAKEYADALYGSTGQITCIADRDMIIAVSGAPQKEFLTKPLCNSVEKAVNSRKAIIIPKPGEHEFCDACPIKEELGECKSSMQVIVPIISENDLIGAIILLGKDPGVVMGDMEVKIAETAAGFLVKQMKQ